MADLLQHLYRENNILAVLDKLAVAQPDKIAITIGPLSKPIDVTYGELLKRGAKYGAAIEKFTMPGDRVILALPTNVHFLDFFVGCLLTNRVPVPLPIEKVTSRFSRFKSVVDDASPAMVVCETAEDFRKMSSKDFMTSSSVKTIFVEELDRDQVPQSSGGQATYTKTTSENAIALIQYTSGSTSDPKGVVLTHKNIISNIRMIVESMEITSDERVVSWLPLHHDMGLIGMLLTPVCSGAWTRLYPYQEFAREPLSWLEQCHSQGASLSGAANFAFDVVSDRLKKIDQRNLGKLRLLYCGSERIAPSSIKRFFSLLAPHGLRSDIFFPCYGLAEGSLLVSGGFVSPDNLLSASTYPNCGGIANGLTVSICDEIGKQVAPRSIGRIFINGPSVSIGYWRNISGKVANNELSESANWSDSTLDTGDLGYLAGRNLFITGRAKDVIKVRATTYYPDDLEHIIEIGSDWFSSGGVVATSAFDAENEKLVIIAELKREKRREGGTTPVQLIYQALSQLSLIPDRVVLVDPLSLPKTSSGKKQRRRTLQMLGEGQLSIVYDSSAGTEEQSAKSKDSPKQSPPKVISDIENELLRWTKTINLNLADERRTFTADLLLRAHQTNLLSLLVSKEHGGLGLGSVEFAYIGRLLGRIDFSLAGLIGNHNTIGILPILKSNTLKRRDHVLEEVAKLGRIVAFAITEPGAGSNPRAMATTAKPSSRGIVLNGEKIWIGNSNLADYINVFAKEFDSNGIELGISAFLLDRRKHAYEISEEQLTFGLRAMPQARLILNNVEIGPDDRLSPPGKGLSLAFPAMEFARFGLAATCVGAMEKALEIAESFVENRSIWTGSQIANQHVLRKLWYARVRKSALWNLVDSTSVGAAASGPSTEMSLVYKILAGEWTFSSVDDLLQLCGGRGYTESFGLARIQRDVRVVRIFEGPTEALAFQFASSFVARPSLLHDLAKANGFESPNIASIIFQLEQKGLQPGTQSEAFLFDIGVAVSEILAFEAFVSRVGADKIMRRICEDMSASTMDVINRLIASPQLSYQPYQRDSAAVPLVRERPLYDIWSGASLGASGASRGVLEPLPNLGADNQIPVSTLHVSTALPSLADLIDVRLALVDWLKKHRRISSVDPSIPLSSYGVDSLLGYELLCFVEDMYQVTLPEALISTRPSIDELAQKIVVSKSATVRSPNELMSAHLKNGGSIP